MKRFMELSMTAEFRTWPNSEELAIEFGSINVPEFCCELALVLYDHVESLTLKSETGGCRVRLVADAEDERRLEVELVSQDFYEVILGELHIFRWLNFFLKYYRDGMAQVNHFHFEGERKDLELTIYVQEFGPSMPSDEARKILGLDE